MYHCILRIVVVVFVDRFTYGLSTELSLLWPLLSGPTGPVGDRSSVYGFGPGVQDEESGTKTFNQSWSSCCCNCLRFRISYGLLFRKQSRANQERNTKKFLKIFTKFLSPISRKDLLDKCSDIHPTEGKSFKLHNNTIYKLPQ